MTVQELRAACVSNGLETGKVRVMRERLTSCAPPELQLLSSLKGKSKTELVELCCAAAIDTNGKKSELKTRLELHYTDELRRRNQGAAAVAAAAAIENDEHAAEEDAMIDDGTSALRDEVRDVDARGDDDNAIDEISLQELLGESDDDDDAEANDD